VQLRVASSVDAVRGSRGRSSKQFDVYTLKAKALLAETI